MKKLGLLLFAIAPLTLLISCIVSPHVKLHETIYSSPRIDIRDADNIKITSIHEFVYKDHVYIINRYTPDAMYHAPHCPCHKQEIKTTTSNFQDIQSENIWD